MKLGALVAIVLSISDGDTLRVRQANRSLSVRLACIDAPETRQAPDGNQARNALLALAPPGSTVELTIKAWDRYGRAVAEVHRGGRNLNQALVASGAAFVYWPYIRSCDRQTYGRLEREARFQRLGVWRSAGGLMRPWQFRHPAHRGAEPAALGSAGPIGADHHLIPELH